MDAKCPKVLLGFFLIMFSCSDPQVEELERQTQINKDALEQLKNERSIRDQENQLKSLRKQLNNPRQKIKPIPKSKNHHGISKQESETASKHK